MAGTNGAKRGGANGGGGSAKGVAAAREEKKAAAVDAEIKRVENYIGMPAGKYVDEYGDETNISYRNPNEFAVEMLVDGKPMAKVYTQYEGEYRIEDYTGSYYGPSVTGSAKTAAKVFGKPKDWGLKKSK